MLSPLFGISEVDFTGLCTVEFKIVVFALDSVYRIIGLVFSAVIRAILPLCPALGLLSPFSVTLLLLTFGK